VHAGHDRASESLARSSVEVDLLSDVLHTVRLTAALFFRVEIFPPWVMELPDGATLASTISSRTQNVVSYHIVTRGACWGGLTGGEPVRLEAGDVLVFPRGDPYAMSTSRGMRGGPPREEILTFMREMSAGRLPFVVREGGDGGEPMDLVCGFLGCDMRPFNPLLATLPRMIHLSGASGARAQPLGRLIELTIDESKTRRPGSESVRLRLSELLFVEVVRECLASLDSAQTGWLAALRDPTVARALALLHQRFADAWTLDALASEVGASRSTLAERFAYFVGQPPMQYLTHWRMQLAARLLEDKAAKVASVALAVGYESEAAFSRAFKRISGVSPAVWRVRRAVTRSREVLWRTRRDRARAGASGPPGAAARRR
jgi:AraC-like DNA-binding protein